MVEEDNIFYNYVYLDPRKPGDYNYGYLHFDFEPFYVGKGKNDRYLEHLNESRYNNKFKSNKIKKIKKDGLKPIILKIYDNLDEKTAFENEIHLIKIIGRHDLLLGPLTNLTDGGEGGATYCVIVYQYNLQGKLIKKYNSINDAYISTNVKGISNCCNNKMKTAGGFIWSYIELTDYEIEIKIKNAILNKKCKTIYQYKNNILINKFESLSIASKSTKIDMSTISDCCNGNKKTAGGYIWSYNKIDDDNLIEILNKNKYNNNCKHVGKYDLNDNLIDTFESLTEAGRINNININGISECCRGIRKTSGKYKWRFL